MYRRYLCYVVLVCIRVRQPLQMVPFLNSVDLCDIEFLEDPQY